jgi:hypothetical protein
MSQMQAICQHIQGRRGPNWLAAAGLGGRWSAATVRRSTADATIVPQSRPSTAQSMDISTVANVLAQRIAEAMIDGFNRHYRLIRRYGQQAKLLFEAADWKGVHDAVRERIRSYDDRVSETAESAVCQLRRRFARRCHLAAAQAVLHRPTDQPQAARTRRDLLQLGVLEDPAPHVFQQRLHLCPAGGVDRVHPVLPADLPQLLPGAARPAQDTIRQIIVDFDWQRPFEDLDRDVDYIMRTAGSASATGQGPRPTRRSRFCTRLSTATRAPTFRQGDQRP